MHVIQADIIRIAYRQKLCLYITTTTNSNTENAR